MRRALALFVLLVAMAVAQAQTADPRLTVSDVESVTGVKPVHIVAAGALPGAGPGLNFATADNKMLLMVNFGTDALYRRAKEQKELTVGGKTMPFPLFHAAITGIGDEAFDSPPGRTQYVLYMRKGTKAASLTTYFAGPNPRLTMDALKALAKIVAARL